MKRFVLVIAGLGVALAALAFAQGARAADEPMTEAHIERIRGNCVEAQSVLRRLHASDALLRVNRGQLYEQISTKLMAPLNSRIALNRMDGMDLGSITADYDDQLNVFRRKYQTYEESMREVLEMNCMERPVTFYDNVNKTRELRQEVHQSTLRLHKTIGDYRTEFEAFAKTIKDKDQN